MDLIVPLTGETAGALGEFWTLASAWDLTQPQETCLLNVPRPGYAMWKSGTATTIFGLNMNRLHCLLRIHDAWAEEHASEANLRRWLREPNAATPFEGNSPLDFLLCASTASLRNLLAQVELQPA